MKEQKLTPKQEAYCQAYRRAKNKTEAYIEAFDTQNMKRETINRKAVELHEKPHITARLRQLFDELEEASKMDVAELVKTLSQMVRFDMGEFYDENGCLKNVHQMSLIARQMISHAESQESYNSKGEFVGTTKKIRSISKLDAIEKLMKHLGAYEKDNAQKKPEITIDLNSLSTEELIKRSKAVKSINEQA